MLNLTHSRSITMHSLYNVLCTMLSSCLLPASASWHAVASFPEPRSLLLAVCLCKRAPLHDHVTGYTHTSSKYRPADHFTIFLCLMLNVLVSKTSFYAGRVGQRLCVHLPVLIYWQHWLNPRSLGARQAPTKVLHQAARAQRRAPGLAKRQTSICL